MAGLGPFQSHIASVILHSLQDGNCHGQCCWAWPSPTVPNCVTSLHPWHSSCWSSGPAPPCRISESPQLGRWYGSSPGPEGCRLPVFVPEVQQFSSINTSPMVACSWLTSRVWKWLFLVNLCSFIIDFWREDLPTSSLGRKWKFCLPEVHFRLGMLGHSSGPLEGCG